MKKVIHEHAIDAMREGVIEGFQALGGLKRPKRMRLKLSTDEADVLCDASEVEGDVLKRSRIEARAEIIRDLYRSRVAIRATSRVDFENDYESDAAKACVEFIDDAIKGSPPDSVVIMSYEMAYRLTRLLSSMSVIPYFSETYDHNTPRYSAHGRTIFSDQFSNIADPISICQPGWFNYSCDEIAIAAERVYDSELDEIIQLFDTDVMTMIDVSKIVNIDVFNISNLTTLPKGLAFQI